MDELASYGLVKMYWYLGTQPFVFGEVSPTYALFLRFSQQAFNDRDPEDDIRQVAVTVVQKGTVTGPELAREAL